MTMMAPTLVMEHGRPSVVIGALGGNKILTAVGQTLVNLLDHAHGPVEAVSAPRLHVDRGDVHAEGRIPATIIDALRRDGLRVRRHIHNYDLYFAMVQALRIGQDGALRGASDPAATAGWPCASEPSSLEGGGVRAHQPGTRPHWTGARRGVVEVVEPGEARLEEPVEPYFEKHAIDG